MHSPPPQVTTPAFVAEHAKRESGALMANCECLVLDEADMLLEGGFLSQVSEGFVGSAWKGRCNEALA